MNNWFSRISFLSFWSFFTCSWSPFSLSSTKGKFRQPYPPKTFIPFLSVILSIDIQLIKNRWAVVDDYIDVLLHDLSLESGYTIFLDKPWLRGDDVVWATCNAIQAKKKLLGEKSGGSFLNVISGFRSELHWMYGMESMSANKTEVQSNFKYSKNAYSP
jgi:hypothetical protein